MDFIGEEKVVVAATDCKNKVTPDEGDLTTAYSIGLTVLR